MEVAFNDYGFENIFSREFEAIASSNDVLIAFTTSGKSRNILNLIEKAEDNFIKFFVLTGINNGDLPLGENILNVPSDQTAIIQQLHLIIGHLICNLAKRIYL